MHALAAPSDVRRGLFAAVDGLALWLLAVILAAFVAAPVSEGAADGFVSTVTAVTAHWLATPGVGPFETVAYLGLSIAILGPGWYWALKPFFSEEPRPDGGRRPDEHDSFVFDGEPKRRESRSKRNDPEGITRSLMTPTGPEDWVGELLEGRAGPAGLPDGDFYRGGTATSEAPSTGTDARSPNLSTVEELGLELDRAVGEMESVYVADVEEARGNHWTVPNTAAFVRAARAGELVEAIADVDVEDRPRERSDPMARLADEVGASRARLERVSNRLRLATDDRSANRAEKAIDDLLEGAHEQLAPLRDHDPAPGVDLASAVAEVRADQRRIEDAFAEALSAD